MQAILVFSFVMYKPAKYGDYYYPLWADALGWGLALISILPIPIVAAYKLIMAPGSTFAEVMCRLNVMLYCVGMVI